MLVKPLVNESNYLPSTYFACALNSPLVPLYRFKQSVKEHLLGKRYYKISEFLNDKNTLKYS